MVKRFTSHTLMALAEASLIALLVVGLIAGTALAGKPSGGGGKGGGGKTTATGSFTLRLVDANDSTVNWGDDITFDVTSTATYTFVDVDCSQDGQVVFHQGAGFYPGYPFSKVYSLENWQWTSGGAACDARLYYTRADGTYPKTLATMSFAVAP